MPFQRMWILSNILEDSAAQEEAFKASQGDTSESLMVDSNGTDPSILESLVRHSQTYERPK